MAVPTRKTSESELDQFNIQFRSSPLYQNFMRSRGLPTNGHAKLSDKQQGELEQAMARAGFKVPSGMHIDQGGNLNQKNRLVRNVAIAAAVGAGTIATLGAAGVIAGGVGGGFGLGGGAAAAGAAGGAGAGAGAAGAGAAGAGGLLASSAAPIAYSGLVPAATMVGTGATTAGLGAAAAASGASLAAGGIGSAPLTAAGYAGTAGAGGGGSLAALAGTPTATGLAPYAGTGGGSVGSTVSNVARSGGMGADTWIDIGSKGADFLGNYIGGKATTGASDRAADLQRQTATELLAFEREKRQDALDQQKRKEAAEERNFKIAQEEKLEDLRRLDEKEAQGEPARLAREATYRAYMKKYWNLDVAPSVARTPRQIASSNMAADAEDAGAPPTNHAMAVDPEPTSQPLASLATPSGYRGATQQFAAPVPQIPPSIAAAEDPRMAQVRRQRMTQGDY